VGDKIDYEEKHRNSYLTVASKEVGLEINVEKNKYMLLFIAIRAF
jgi:hypothetical protein